MATALKSTSAWILSRRRTVAGTLIGALAQIVENRQSRRNRLLAFGVSRGNKRVMRITVARCCFVLQRC